MQDSSKTEKSAKVSRCYFCWGEETEEIGIVKSDSSFMEDSGKITKKKMQWPFVLLLDQLLYLWKADI